MRFILGAVAGFAAGMAASTLSSGKLGRDLRDELEGIRADVEKRDFEAVGGRLEERFKDLQASLEQRSRAGGRCGDGRRGGRLGAAGVGCRRCCVRGREDAGRGAGPGLTPDQRTDARGPRPVPCDPRRAR